MDNKKLLSLAIKNRIRARLLTEARKNNQVRIEEKRTEIGNRIRQLKELAHYTFVTFVGQHASDPEYRKDYWEGFVAAKPRIKTLGIEGGDRYNRAINALKFYWDVDNPNRKIFIQEVEELLLTA